MPTYSDHLFTGDVLLVECEESKSEETGLEPKSFPNYAVRAIVTKLASYGDSRQEIFENAPQVTGDREQLLYYSCPITQAAFKDPVVASDGYTYERNAISAWQAREQELVEEKGEETGGVARSPITRDLLEVDDSGELVLIDNGRMLTLVNEYCEKLAEVGVGLPERGCDDSGTVLSEFDDNVLSSFHLRGIGLGVGSLIGSMPSFFTAGNEKLGFCAVNSLGNESSLESDEPVEQAAMSGSGDIEEGREAEPVVRPARPTDGGQIISWVNPNAHFESSGSRCGVAHIIATKGWQHSGILLEYYQGAVLHLVVADIKAIVFSGRDSLRDMGRGVITNVRVIEKTTPDLNSDEPYSYFRNKEEAFIPKNENEKKWTDSILGLKVSSIGVTLMQVEALLQVFQRDQVRTARAIAESFLLLERKIKEQDREQHVESGMHISVMFDEPTEPATDDEGRTDNRKYEDEIEDTARRRTIANDFLRQCTVIKRRLAGVDIELLSREALVNKANDARKFLINMNCHGMRFIASNLDLMRTSGQLDNELDYLAYRFGGSRALFYGSTNNSADGVNCTEWCRTAFSQLGILDLSGGKQKPKKAVSDTEREAQRTAALMAQAGGDPVQDGKVCRLS